MSIETTTERTVFAEKAKDAYLNIPLNPAYGEVEVDPIAETDAFIAGWDSAVTHLQSVTEDMDIPAPLKAIIGDILDANRAEVPVKK